MRVVGLIASILMALTLVSVCRAYQGGLDLGNRTVPTSDELIAQAGSEASARALVDASLRAHFASSSESQTIRFVAGQVRPDWLPSIDGVTFVLLTDDEARVAYASCAGCCFLSPIRAIDGLVSVTINQGNVCVTRTNDYRFRLEQGIWSQDYRSVSGSIQGTNHCECSP